MCKNSKTISYKQEIGKCSIVAISGSHLTNGCADLRHLIGTFGIFH